MEPAELVHCESKYHPQHVLFPAKSSARFNPPILLPAAILIVSASLPLALIVPPFASDITLMVSECFQ